MHHIATFVLSLMLFTILLGSAAGQEVRAYPADLEETLDLYLSADDFYREGDLITRSQLSEFQLYLRRTRGPSLATHKKWAQSALADRDLLANLFHNGGASMIRATVQQAGGYAELDLLTRTPRGRTTVQKAIKAKSPEQIFAAIAARKAKEKAAQDANPEARPKVPETLRIYTAADYVNAVKKAAATTAQPKTSASLETPVSPEKADSVAESAD